MLTQTSQYCMHQVCSNRTCAVEDLASKLALALSQLSAAPQAPYSLPYEGSVVIDSMWDSSQTSTACCASCFWASVRLTMPEYVAPYRADMQQMEGKWNQWWRQSTNMCDNLQQQMALLASQQEATAQHLQHLQIQVHTFATSAPLPPPPGPAPPHAHHPLGCKLVAHPCQAPQLYIYAAVSQNDYFQNTAPCHNPLYP